MLFSIEKNKKEPKVAGFAKVGFNEDGTKGVILSYDANNPYIKEDLCNFVDEDINSLIYIGEIKSRIGDISNKMFLITFFYEPYSSFNGEHTEWDIDISLGDFILLDDDFKKTWQLQLSADYFLLKEEIINKEPIECEEIEIFENFYEETFEFID